MKNLLFIFLNKLNLYFFSSILILFFTLMNSSSIYIQWLSMEFSTISMISMINIKSKNKIVSILYFFISSISSLLIIMIISLNFSQLLIIKNFNINNLLCISMFLKIGMFPFTFWMIYIYNMSSWNQIFIISTFMKFIPIYFFSSLIFYSSNLLTYLIINNMFISLYTNLNFSIKKLFSCSSIFNSLFFILILNFNKNLFILLMMLYMFIFFMLMILLKFYNINNLNFLNLSKYSFYLLSTMLLIYSSFPLFLTFMFKWEFIYIFNLNFSNNLLIILLLSSMFMLWNYLILFKYLIIKFKFNKTMMKIEFFNFKNMILILISFYSLTFLSFNMI